MPCPLLSIARLSRHRRRPPSHSPSAASSVALVKDHANFSYYAALPLRALVRLVPVDQPLDEHVAAARQVEPVLGILPGELERHVHLAEVATDHAQALAELGERGRVGAPRGERAVAVELAATAAVGLLPSPATRLYTFS